MAAISQTVFSDTFMSIQRFVFLLRPNGQIDNNTALVQIMASDTGQAIIWTNAHPIHWRLNVALGGDELTLRS